MNAQKQMLGLGSSVLALAGAAAKLRSSFNEKGSNKAKKSYEKNANIKKENNELTKKSVDRVEQNATPVKIDPEATNESNLIHTQSPIGSEAPQKQKFILSEEGATFPITAENAKTDIKVDEDVASLIEVRQKNLNRAAAGKRSSEQFQQMVWDFAKKKNMGMTTYADAKKAMYSANETLGLGTAEQMRKAGLKFEDSVFWASHIEDNFDGVGFEYTRDMYDRIMASIKDPELKEAMENKYAGFSDQIDAWESYNGQMYGQDDDYKEVENADDKLKEMIADLQDNESKQNVISNWTDKSMEEMNDEAVERYEEINSQYWDNKEDTYNVWDEGEIVF